VKNYLLCTQQPWAKAVYAAVRANYLEGDPSCPFRLLDAAPAAPRSIETEADDETRYIFFLHWSTRIPAQVFERWECVNLHCTPLPYGRGGSPVENMIVRGFRETVITAHRVEAEIDAGPVYAISRPVSLAGSRDQIFARFVQPCALLVHHICDREPKAIPQEEHARFRRWPAEERESFWRGRG
jgi:methionyl-tRNA formyltransferase